MKKTAVIILIITVLVGLLVIFKSYTEESTASEQPEPETVITQDQAVNMINNLIAKNATFLVQIAPPELPINIRIWQRKGQLKLPVDIPWETFKKDVHQFGVDLHTLLEKDAKGIYYHIETVRKDPTLYKLLAYLNQQLAQSQKGKTNGSIATIGKESTAQIIAGINLYATIFYQQKLLDRLKALLAKFEERAKLLRTKEEEAQKSAEQIDTAPSGDDFDFDFSYPEIEEGRYEEATEPDRYETEDILGDQEGGATDEELAQEINIEDIDWGF